MRLTPAITVCAALSLALPAAAQETGSGGISIELNAVRNADGGCRLSFLVTNGHASNGAAAVYETVLFDTAGRVKRLTLFNFGVLSSLHLPISGVRAKLAGSVADPSPVSVSDPSVSIRA